MSSGQSPAGGSRATVPAPLGAGPPHDGFVDSLAGGLSWAWRTLTDNVLPLALALVLGAFLAGFVVAHTGTDDRGALRDHLKAAYGAELWGPAAGNGVRQVRVLKDSFEQICTLDDRNGPDHATLTLCLPAH
jgi:hypothetical protein